MVVNTRNGKAYAAFPDLGVVKIVNGTTGAVIVLHTGANVKDLTLDPRDGRVYAMNRGPGTISVIDPDTDAVVDTLKADRGSLTALNPATNRLYVSASTGTDPLVIDLATRTSTAIHAGTEGNALSVNVKSNEIYFVGYQDDFLTDRRRRHQPADAHRRAGLPSVGIGLQRSDGHALPAEPQRRCRHGRSTRERASCPRSAPAHVPMAVAVNEVTNRVYVVNYGSSDVTVIDGAVAPPDRDGRGRIVAAADRRQHDDQHGLRRQHPRRQRVGDRWPHQHRGRHGDDRQGTVGCCGRSGRNLIFVANRLSDKVTVIDGRTNRATQR